METGRPHQNSQPRRDATKKSCTKDAILFYTPVKPSLQLVKMEDGEGHTSITAKENPQAAENLVQVAKLNGPNMHNSTCSTPIKNPFGTPSQLQTPTSKLSFLSASEHKHSVGAGVCRVNEDASITRTPFRLLAGKNLNACLFSPSHTPRPIAFPSPFDKLVSPALKGYAKRVLVIPPPLSPARRVPVKQKRSQLTTAGKQSPFATPKSSRVDNVPFATPKSSRVDNVFKAAGQNDDGYVIQHQDARNVEVNHDKKNIVGSALPKRVLAFMPQQSPCATPNSRRVEHVLKEGHQNNGVSEGKVMQHHDADARPDRAKLDRSEMLKSLLASMPQLSSPARRVPLLQKRKEPVKIPPPLHHKEKQQSATKKSLPETPKAFKSDQRRGKICRNEAGVLDAKRHADGSHQNATKKLQKRVPKGKGGNEADKAKLLSVDAHKIKSGSSKQHDDDINKKYCDDCVDDGNDVKRHCEDGKLHEACDVDVGHDDAKQYDDAEFGGNNAKQHDDDDGTKHHDDDLREDDGTKEHDGDGSKQHDHDDDDTLVGSDNMDRKKQDGDDNAAKQHDHANGVKQHNHDGMKQHNDDDVENGSEEAES